MADLTLAPTQTNKFVLKWTKTFKKKKKNKGEVYKVPNHSLFNSHNILFKVQIFFMRSEQIGYLFVDPINISFDPSDLKTY